MAEESEGHAKVVGQDPKKRKMMAIGIGIAGVFVVLLIYGKSKGGGSSPASTVGPAGGVTADVAVPSGDVSPSDLMAQFATTEQATQAQYNSSYQAQIAAQTELINKLANQKPPVVNVTLPPGVTQPPVYVPPPVQKPPTPPPPPPAPHQLQTVTVLPWGAHTGDMISGHPWQSTLWGIATHYHTDWPTIWKANPQIANPNLIHPGDVIKIPGT